MPHCKYWSNTSQNCIYYLLFFFRSAYIISCWKAQLRHNSISNFISWSYIFTLLLYQGAFRVFLDNYLNAFVSLVFNFDSLMISFAYKYKSCYIFTMSRSLMHMTIHHKGKQVVANDNNLRNKITKHK